MKLNGWHLVIGVLAGVAIGRLSSPKLDPASVATAKNEDRRYTKYAERPGHVTFTDRTTQLRNEIRKAPSTSIPALMYRALETADNQDRIALGLEALSRVDESNWKEVLAQFGKITHETGREHDFLWRQAVTMIGKNAGQAALEEWRSLGLSKFELQSRNATYGWATKDPDAALAWVNELGETDPASKTRLLPLVLGGTALMDIAKATQMLSSLPEKERSACVGDFAWNVVQSGGMDAAVEWMITVRRAATAQNDPFAAQVTNEVMRKMLDTIGDGNYATGQDAAAAMAERLELIQSAAPMNGEAMQGHLSRLSGGMALRVIGELSRGQMLGELDSSPLLQVAVRRAVDTSPQQSVQWFSENASSPAHGHAALLACQRLSEKGDKASAQAIMETVKDAGVRSRIAAAAGL